MAEEGIYVLVHKDGATERVTVDSEGIVTSGEWAGFTLATVGKAMGNVLKVGGVTDRTKWAATRVKHARILAKIANEVAKQD
jgi:hypothetical protein